MQVSGFFVLSFKSAVEKTMKEGVDELCDRLLAIDLEKEELHVELSSIGKVFRRGENCLLAKLLSTKYYNKEAFKATMRKAWRITKPIKFYAMGGGLMMVKFVEKFEKNRVLREGP